VPNAATTQASSACETTGAPIPLSYGYVWATGKRHAYYTLQETGNSTLDYYRVGFWLLGHGEWDGLVELWINDLLAWKGDTTIQTTWEGWNFYQTLDSPVGKNDIVFNWHSGCDSVIGTGLTPQSTGPDQNCDLLWSVFPPAIQPLDFSRIAYFGLMRKQPILNQTTGSQSDPSQWTDINPIGLWRGLRCRLFDADGNVTGYAFTRNPVWHWVDVTLRRELFPDYKLIQGLGPDPLPAAVSARFNWSKIYASALYCNQPVASGQARFSGDYSFAAQTSLQAIKSQILLCCRAFEQDSQGQLAIVVDQPRPSVFTFSRDHILPGSWEASDKPLTTKGNRYLGTFRDLLIPAMNTIASITDESQADPIVTTETPHGFEQGDWIAIGGTDTIYDAEWEISSVPDIVDPGTPEEVDPTTFTIARKGDNYPTSVGSGGAVGLLYSRFKERVPEFWHKTNMLARGVWGLNIARSRNKVKQPLDFATSTYDQVSRISRYERDRDLGFDETPYVTPARIKLKTSFFAEDVNGNLAAGIECGDRVTLDPTASWTYQGDYEVVDPLVKTPPTSEVSPSGDTLARAPSPESGEVELTLQTYDEAYMYDTSDATQAGWPSVPGSYPGNDTAYSSVPLANGGNFVFFTGSLASGSSFQLPSTGYPASNAMVWASPASANIQFHSAHVVQLCDANSNLLLTLVYADDEGTTWGGDVNYACLTWLSPDVTNTDSNGMTWLPLTLLGGEEILWGVGVLADGATIELPAGWTAEQCSASAYIHDQAPTGNIMFLAGAYVDSDLVVHVNASDDSGHTWHGNASVLVFAWKNNMDTVTSETLFVTPSGGGPAAAGLWLHFPLSDGSIFSVGSTMIAGIVSSAGNLSTLTLPTSAGDGDTLEPMLGSANGSYESGSNHAQGIGACYLDEDNVVHVTFNDGSGDTWAGTAGIFACYTTAATEGPTIVRIQPGRTSTALQGGQVQFSAQLLGNTSQTLTWYVDDIAGGNASVGTIDGTGLYTAPTADGLHTIKAVSSVTASAGTAPMKVSGASAIHIGITGPVAVVSTADQTVSLGAGGIWQLIAGEVSLVAASGSGIYGITVSWTGVTAIAPDGGTLNYSDGSLTMASDQTAVLAVDDPGYSGGAAVSLYIVGTSTPPTGSQQLLGISSVPAAGTTQNFNLPA
jgi:hypothetical protein